jgi:integrase/recombinase XerD
MTSSGHLESSISPLITRYVAVKRMLGRRADEIEYILRRVDRFLVAGHMQDLSRDTFIPWAHSLRQLRPSTQRTRLRVVYHFCLFRRRDEPGCFVPDPMQFPRTPARPFPHIFTEGEIAHVLTAAGSLRTHPGSPLHRDVARLAVVVLYTTGLRREGTRAPHAG